MLPSNGEVADLVQEREPRQGDGLQVRDHQGVREELQLRGSGEPMQDQQGVLTPRCRGVCQTIQTCE